ncbi:hypothetical protein NMG29_24020 [Streptomyces cocklensis]|jgi:hypothetical protein|uniref:Uncharacterized protein n=1 Tax=Actinacidiphila cocklensis TaxID=887465 RepID=A0A9W4GSE7_9ACTN|nr:hypothetical protein [Actinacidiphila cocklensis]MDD1061244.1 hypothetical protein [Actinacidiphila cocklensis]WSX76914.1 hypothetical protein OH826_25595 [Streptomyces sp. NBC_00899]CAG6395799.1 conserved hypothetical protein [Actinacidiphila cocklensis]
MTVFLDIAALLALTLALTFVPLMGARADARITREIRAAERGETPGQPPEPASLTRESMSLRY